jgi:dihydropteroate synthase
VKDTILSENTTINCGGNLISLQEPIVMGIINVTPDSFYDGGKTFDISDIISQAKKHIEEGAKILDIGGYSSKPGAEEVIESEELQRVIPAIEAILKEFPNTIISIDTFRSAVAQKAIDAGAQIINDISAGNLDSKMFDVVTKNQVPYIMMHMQNTPQNMQAAPKYENIVMEVTSFFSEKINLLTSKGAKDIILDVGFGFGKTIEHNYTLLRELKHFKLFGFPILVGISRKSMLYKPLNITPQEALNATTAANMIALQNGAKILRVHDVKEAVEAVEIYKLLKVANLRFGFGW